ncbi:MAG: type II secretion system F family protein, partial [Proteobacteria bacterium]|nr:type II secretion system F family protein [Pseudomonadota bacterium]
MQMREVVRRMAHFRYKALDAEGRSQQGELTARNADQVVALLRERKLTVLHVEEIASAAPAPLPRAAKTRPMPDTKATATPFFGVSKKTLSLFTRQLATTLSAGLPLMRILSLLHKKTKSGPMHVVLEQTGSDLQHGVSFSEALAKHPRVFDSMYLNMIRVGEAGGNLSETVTRLAQMLEKETALQRKVKGALFYPAFVLLFTIVIGYCMLAFLMPMFTPMFQNSGMDIKSQYPLTYLLIQGSAWCSDPKAMGITFVILVMIAVIIKIALQTRAGRYVLDFSLYHAPLFSAMVQQAAAARFCRAFSTLLKSGVPLLQSLQLVADSSGNLVISRSIAKVARNIQSGDRISETLESVKVFPDLVVQMAAIGEEAGSLPEML